MYTHTLSCNVRSGGERDRSPSTDRKGRSSKRCALLYVCIYCCFLVILLVVHICVCTLMLRCVCVCRSRSHSHSRSRSHSRRRRRSCSRSSRSCSQRYSKHFFVPTSQILCLCSHYSLCFGSVCNTSLITHLLCCASFCM